MIDIATLILSALIVPFFLFLSKKVYYLNHKISEVTAKLDYIYDDLRDIKEFIFNRIRNTK